MAELKITGVPCLRKKLRAGFQLPGQQAQMAATEARISPWDSPALRYAEQH